jgi:hypothetical protein
VIVFLKAVPELGLEGGSYPIPRDCPHCRRAGCHDSIKGHGRRPRTCLDERRSRITIRRGRCRACGVTITFLPPILKPYRRYAVPIIAGVIRQLRSGVHYSDLEIHLFDLDAFPDASTVRRWWRAFPRPPTIAA